MIPIRKIEQCIPDMTGCAVLIIAACSFLLSFFNLQAAALEAGITPWLSWLWPVCVDALLIAGSLMILRSSIKGESPLVGWSVLLVFTGVSTLFNVLHSPDRLTAQAAHAVPPIALCVSIELFMMTIKSDLVSVSDQGGVQADRHPWPEDRPHDHPDDQGIATPDQGSERGDGHVYSQVHNARKVAEYFTSNPDSSVSEAARALGVSRSTIRRYARGDMADGQGVVT